MIRKISYIMFGLLAIFNPIRMFADDFEPYNINYDYSLCNVEGELDCVGNLSFCIDIPKNASHIILRKTEPHYSKSYFFFNTGILFTFEDGQTKIDYCQSSIYWGMYFMVESKMKNGTSLCSSIYNTSDLISADDLAKLLQASSTETTLEISKAPVYNPTTKSFEVGENAHLEIFDASGVQLYSGIVCGSFPLLDYSGRFLIIRSVINNQVSTMKIIVK